MRNLAIWAVVCLAVGLAIHPWNPIIKRICTTSFTIYSTGWVLLMLLVFYWVVEVKGYRKWTFPLLVVGANSIFIYSRGRGAARLAEPGGGSVHLPVSSGWGSSRRWHNRARCCW